MVQLEGERVILSALVRVNGDRVIVSYFLSIEKEIRAICWDLRSDGIATLSASSFLGIERDRIGLVSFPQ